MAPEPGFNDPAPAAPPPEERNPIERALDQNGSDQNNGLGTLWQMLGTFFGIGAMTNLTEGFGNIMDSLSEVGLGNGGFDFQGFMDRLAGEELGVQPAPAAPAPVQPAPIVQAQMDPGMSGPR